MGRLAIRAFDEGWELTLNGETRRIEGPLEPVTYGPGDPQSPVLVEDGADPFVVIEAPPEQLPAPDERSWAHFVPADGVIMAFLSELETTDLDITTRRPAAQGPPTFPNPPVRSGPVVSVLAWRRADRLAGLPGPFLLFYAMLFGGFFLVAGIDEGSWVLTLVGASFFSIFCWRWRITREGIDRLWVPFRGYRGHVPWSQGRELRVSGLGTSVEELTIQGRGVHGSVGMSTRRSLRMVAVAAEAGLLPTDTRIQVPVGFGNRRLAERVRRAGVWVL